MPQNWKTYKLQELTSKIGSGATPRGGKEAYKERGTSLIRSQNVLDFSFSINGLAFIDDAQAKALNSVSIESRDVLLNITGDSVARVCKVPDKWLPARVNQHVAIVRANQKILCPKFLLYYLLTKRNKDKLLTLASAGATRNALTKTMIEDFEITMPPIKEQKAIASILSALDDKIELNLQMNKTLEEMAMALYKHWFVDFGPFQNGEFVDSELGVIPKGWEVKRLNEIAHKKSDTFNFSDKKEVVFVNTGDVQEGRFLHSNKISKEGLPGQAKKAIAKDDILYSEIRPKNKRYAYVNFDSSNYVVSTKFMVINPKDNILNKLLYRILTIQSTVDNFNSIAEGRSGTFPQITFDAISEMEVVLPPLKIQKEFQSIVEPIELQQDDLYTETQTLTTLRDTLLPKLISGEVRVKDAEKILTAAL
jgi:type I restriction enzyme S subunit